MNRGVRLGEGWASMRDVWDGEDGWLYGDVDEFGTRYYIRVDRVGYSDGFHPEDCPGGVDLWPTEPDGGGKSLTRKTGADYGNDPDNWTASAPSPCVINP